LIESALAKDEFHPGTPSDIFYEPGVLTSLYSDDQGPVLFVRGYKSLHIDLLCVNNFDVERNRAVMQSHFKVICANAKSAGFHEICTSVNGAALLRFVCRTEDQGGLGFERVEVNGEVSLRKLL
jgi:hypothetical protein